MEYRSNISSIKELALSEGGVFTTAQAARLDIPRDALAYAARSGRIERIAQGAYRYASAEDDGYDELRALWKLTNPDSFSYERMSRNAWDGVAICGPTASAILEIGDLYATPYHISVPRRFNSRKAGVIYIRHDISRDDITWIKGLPVTTPAATIATLVWEHEDPSLVADVFTDAVRKYGATTLNIRNLEEMLGEARYKQLLEGALIYPGSGRRLIPLDKLGHVALMEVDSDE